MISQRVGVEALLAMGLGMVLGLLVPILLTIWWCVKKKENFTTVLIGGAVFLVFVFVLEKPLQNALIFGDHPVADFINARPVLWAFLVGLFPGVFEETGRFIAFKTVLKKRRNKRTSISYGIGHGGIEVMLLFGLTLMTYFTYGIMMDTGNMEVVIEQVATQAPDQLNALQQMMDVISGYTFIDLGWALCERIFAFLFHVGASILVFYAARERRKFWMYPTAIALHTALDFVAGLSMKVIEMPMAVLELIVAVFALFTFCGAYVFYKTDKTIFITD